MKKFLYAIVVLVAACSGNDDAPVQQQPQTDGDIYGKWYQKDTVVNGNVFPYDDHEPCGKDYIEFYDANMVRSVDVWDCEEDIFWVGTFTKNGNQLTVTNGSESQTVEIIELSNTSLVFKYEEDYDEDGTTETILERFDR